MRRAVLTAIAIGSLAAAPAAAQVSASGDVSAELRTFPSAAGLQNQSADSVQPSFTAEAKVEAAARSKKVVVSFNPYVRYDSVDSGRSIVDLHEAKIATGGEWWHLKAGYDVEFWGVMEIVNPVNVLNQSDITDDFLGKRKLGRPMVDYTLLGAFGTLDFYALTGFQPMRFPESTGRLRPPLPIDRDQTLYGSPHGRSQLEGAVRYSRNIRNVFLGVSHFYGYAPEPDILIMADERGMPFLRARYDVEQQSGLELQITFGNLILKSEDVLRLDAHGTRQSDASSIGGEYDLGSALHTGRTVTVFGEYYRDSRPTSLVIPFTNDVFAGVRIGANDRRSSEVRVWSSYDVATHKTGTVMVDASTRLSERFKASVAYRGIVTGGAAFTSVERDSHVVVRLEAFF